MKSRGDMAVMIVCAATLLATVTVSRAQELADPTRPPAGLEKPTGVAGEVAGSAGGGLQAIIRHAGRKPAAVIDGEYVVQGGLVGDARVVKIGDDSVLLKGAMGQETLKLSPDVEKTPVQKTEAGTGDKKTGEKARKR